ncbi:unnamed protein product [Prunus brigantina]
MAKHRNPVSTVLDKVEHKNPMNTAVGNFFFNVVKTDQNTTTSSTITIATESETNKGNINGGSSGHTNNHRNNS